jgi:hypothetical protein
MAALSEACGRGGLVVQLPPKKRGVFRAQLLKECKPSGALFPRHPKAKAPSQCPKW